jgi:phage-related protein
MKTIIFLGDSRDRIRAFPENAKHDTGAELQRVQFGAEPVDWKPMPSIGIGVKEIRVRDERGLFRTVYLATRPEGVYVLHAFQKKTQATAKKDIALAAKRLREVPRRST